MEFINDLLEAAKNVRKNAYAPYSGFHVGAALLTENGDIYRGCNVENASLGLTTCAERTAVYSAIADGNRSFKAIAVISDLSRPVAPCGACRQILFEFAPDIWVINANLEGSYKVFRLSDLLPEAFIFEKINDKANNPG